MGVPAIAARMTPLVVWLALQHAVTSTSTVTGARAPLDHDVRVAAAAAGAPWPTCGRWRARRAVGHASLSPRRPRGASILGLAARCRLDSRRWWRCWPSRSPAPTSGSPAISLRRSSTRQMSTPNRPRRPSEPMHQESRTGATCPTAPRPAPQQGPSQEGEDGLADDRSTALQGLPRSGRWPAWNWWRWWRWRRRWTCRRPV